MAKRSIALIALGRGCAQGERAPSGPALGRWATRVAGSYARFLGQELWLNDNGPLLLVMPNG